jgi:predicted enzyme related to lactoylglutathione lyase
VKVDRLTPILNVSNLAQSFEWFCEGGQGGRGSTGLPMTFGPNSHEALEKGVWMSMWVDDVDAVHKRCLEHGIEITRPPTNMPWGACEVHVRHPGGRVFRVSQGIEETA